MTREDAAKKLLQVGRVTFNLQEYIESQKTVEAETGSPTKRE